MCFRSNFGCKFTAIIDCFELFIDRLTNLIACNLTWLNYSHIAISHNTGKCVVGITPKEPFVLFLRVWVNDSSIRQLSGN